MLAAKVVVGGKIGGQRLVGKPEVVLLSGQQVII